MPYPLSNFFFLPVLLLVISCNQYPSDSLSDTVEVEMKGLSMVAPPQPFTTDPSQDIIKMGANWIAVMPFAYTPPNRPKVIYNPGHWDQWWGERPEGVATSIELAKRSGLKIMLKPQVYCPSSWPGALSYENTSDRKKWESDYRAYLMQFLNLAIEYQVELFCIGTELDRCVQDNPSFWKNLITEIKKSYKGKLTYAANWDQYEHIPLWSELDYIGIDAYFPLDESSSPTRKKLIKAWSPIKKSLAQFSKKEGKDIIFTEFGYLSVDGTAGKNWELEDRIQQLPINEKAQAIAIESLWTTYAGTSWWKGGFLWKWFPEGKGHEGYPEKDYTPQDKAAEVVLKKLWSKSPSKEPLEP